MAALSVDAIAQSSSSEGGGGTIFMSAAAAEATAVNPIHPLELEETSEPSKPQIHFNKPKIGIKARLVLDLIDDLNEEFVLDVILAYHFEHPSLIKTVAPGQRTVIRWPTIEELYESHSGDSQFVCPRVDLVDYRSLDLKKEFILEYFALGRITIIREYRVVIKGSFKLDRFPFDRQIVRIEFETFSAIMSNWSAPLDESPPIITQNKVCVHLCGSVCACVCVSVCLCLSVKLSVCY